ncbi:PP2C family protein-serine/threonine phosphatase [Rhodopirellula sp. MGV]|uniref:PP2C family protein-serine/threonine phosphatase n=1 Tax=Rhodopirellula sp. MGV TaxID=2023130 RepID=UPI000B97A128|nr:protein phosphatase 2C domain-containing protein [Rhodopirellula sp. MGV]OYP31037.1 protein phosphatase [Rhodopirellula sp. MGV]PNY34616.1 serine/threonine-protein phosphatase [Rhodopirellula baltica]
MQDSEFEFTQSETFGLTDIGRHRAINQDQFLIAELSKSMLVSASSLDEIPAGRFYGRMQGQVLLVADGMGGHAAGEKASSVAAQHLITRLLNSVHWFFHSDADNEDDFVNALRQLLRDAHSRVLAEARDDLENAGMGTTLTMAYINWPTMYVVHAGDSRCYLIRDGNVKQLTTDHTLARQMVEAGGMRPEDEATSRWSNVLWNVLGGHGEREILAEVHRVDLHPHDSILLCSDGLYRYLDNHKLGQLVSQQSDASLLCRELIDLANDAGGEDNITVVVAHPKPTDGHRRLDSGLTIDNSVASTVSDRPTDDLSNLKNGLDD